MPCKQKFRFLEHVADAYIESCGKNYEECFENAALALFEVMTDTGKVNPKQEKTIEAEGEDLEALLYDWLEKLLLLIDIEGFLASKFKVERIESVKGGYKVKARIWGEPIDPSRHPSKSEVKAVTYHQMKVFRDEEGVKARFILDL